MIKLQPRQKAFTRVITAETLEKLRASRRANQSDFTLSFTEKSGNKFTVSSAAFEQLGLDKNSVSFDVVTSDTEGATESDFGAYVIVMAEDKGIFFTGKKVKEGKDGKAGEKSKSITYNELIDDLQKLGLVAEDAKANDSFKFDFEAVEYPTDEEILAVYKIVPSTKSNKSDKEIEEEVTGVKVEGEDTATVEATVEPTQDGSVEADEADAFK